jgi:GT2 family glycosyltransferase
VTIVIPTIEANPDLLAKCLISIDAYTPDHVGVIVANRLDATFAENANEGAASTDSDIIIFLNDDCEVTDGWYEALVAPFQDPEVQISGCRLTYPDGRLQHAGIYLDFVDGILTAHNHLTDQPGGPVAAVTGACMAVRRGVACFDTAFRNGYEDVDLCLRVGGVHYTPLGTVVHHESASGPRRWQHVSDNIKLLHYRWANVVVDSRRSG